MYNDKIQYILYTVHIRKYGADPDPAKSYPYETMLIRIRNMYSFKISSSVEDIAMIWFSL